MKLNHKIKIDLLKVFKTGKFDYLKIGKTKNWILNNFPDPDEHEAGKSVQSARFWRYGNIDFFFDKDRLSHIYTDYIDSLKGGKSIEIEKWILNEPDKLTVSYVIQQLLEERIRFQVKHHLGEYICQTSIGLTDSSILLNFQPEDIDINDYEKWYKTGRKLISPNDHKLCSFTLMNIQKLKAAYDKN